GMAAHGGRPKIQEVLTYWPSLIDRRKVKQQLWLIESDGTSRQVQEFSPGPVDHQESRLPQAQGAITDNNLLTPLEGKVSVRMKDLCLARSGDKGNSANLGVLARSRKIYEFLKTRLGE